MIKLSKQEFEKLKMYKNHVLIEPIDKEDKEFTTDSGIVVVQTNYRSKRKYLDGVIIKIGTDFTINGHSEPISDYFNVDDHILYYESGVHEVVVDNKKYVIVRAEDIELTIIYNEE